MVWVTATVYVQDLYVSHSNSALAACAFVRYSVGAAAPMLSGMLREKVGLRRVSSDVTLKMSNRLTFLRLDDHACWNCVCSARTSSHPLLLLWKEDQEVEQVCVT